MEAIGLTASLIGILQLTGKLTTVGYGYIGSCKRAPKELHDLVVELNSLQQVLVFLQGQGTNSSPALQKLHEKGGAIERCFQGLQDLASKLELKSKKDRLMWPLKENETMQHISLIERQKSLFLLAISSDALAISSDTLSFTKVVANGVGDANMALAVIQNTIQTEQIAKTREKILVWLYSPKVDEKHLEINGKRQKNTGEWLLKTPEFQDLIKGKLNFRLLWGYGIPGAGKSFLSSVVIDYLQAKAPTENYGIAYIYFDYKEQARQTPINVMASLVKQLASQIPYMPAEVEKWYRKISHRAPTVEELYTALLTTLKFFNRVFLVFDALDECDQNTQRRELLPLFHRMGNSGINLFLTSREYPDDIQYSLRNTAKIELAPKKEDITAYIESKIDENIRASRLIQQGQCRDRIISEVLDCSKGMFLLAQFHIEYICQQVTTNQILKALDKIKSSSTGERPLDPTYDRAMKSIYGQAKPCANLALKTLSWLVTAKRTLTVDELRVALSLEPHQSELDDRDQADKETLVDVCASLVTIDDNSNTIHLAHYTVQEYLINNLIIPTDADYQIALACTTFLSFDIFARDIPTDTKALELRYESHPFLRYAAEGLDLHLRSCHEEKLLTDMILALIQKPENILFYLQILHSRFSEYPDECANVPPLHAASIIGYCGAVGELLRREGGFLVRDNAGQTALHHAAGWGREAVVRLLLEVGVDHSIQDSFGSTALHVAIYQGHDEITRFLLEKGADSSIRDNKGFTALHAAASKVTGSEEIIRILLEMGADSSILDDSGQTALWLASDRNEGAVRVLLEKGADYSIANNRGQTPLHQATRWGRENIIQLLLEKGADPSIQDNSGQTALLVAITTIGPKEAVVRLLLENGVNHSIPNGKGQTALHAAIPILDVNVVQLLLENGVDVLAKTDTGETALDVAVGLGEETLVQLLLDKGAKFSVPYEDWREAVHAIKTQNEIEKEGKEVSMEYGLPDVKEVQPSEYGHYHQRLRVFLGFFSIAFFPLFSVFRLLSISLIMAFCFVYFWFS